jgi:glycosyltransferase involved in cell wall biosynthesis
MPPPTSDAVIRFEPDGFALDGPQLLGRQSAGAGFLRAAVEGRSDGPVYAYTARQASAAKFSQMVSSFDPTAEVAWIRGERMDEIGPSRGVLYLGDPTLADFARLRMRIGSAAHSLCGITHTLATAGTMQSLVEMLSGAIMPWDALICTSRAALETVLEVLGAEAEFLRWRFGPAIPLRFPQLPVIPLGAHCADFAFSTADKAAAREGLGIACDEIAALYVGRLVVANKANPFPMFHALQAAAERTGKKLALILCGRAPSEALAEAFYAGAAIHAPDVRVIRVDSRDDDQRRGAWAAGDIFISLADSIQETFGLTPVEAMAAGLPIVVTDWNGYKDTVRDGVDGFRITTWAPGPSPAGATFALRQELHVLDFSNYCWAATASTSIDLKQLIDRLVDLVEQPDLRRRMGEAGQARAREVYDWAHVFRQYQALWGDLSARRLAAAQNPEVTAWVSAAPKTPPARLDPFLAFGHYPTHRMGPRTLVAVAPGATLEGYRQLSADKLFPRAGVSDVLAGPIWAILKDGPSTIEAISAAANLSVGWGMTVIGAMAKMGMVEFREPSGRGPDEPGP